MRLEKGSSLEKEERSEMRKLRSSFLQDLLTQELDERKNLLNKKAELQAKYSIKKQDNGSKSGSDRRKRKQ